MFLEELAQHEKVENAARALAGNWQSWKHFVWFGSEDVSNPQNVTIGYITNHEGGVLQDSQYESVKLGLDKYLGNLIDGANISLFSSSFCGDVDMLKGIQARVYDDTGITHEFKLLHALAKLLIHNCPQKWPQPYLDIYYKVNKQHYLSLISSDYTPKEAEILADHMAHNSNFDDVMYDNIMEDFIKDSENELWPQSE